MSLARTPDEVCRSLEYIKDGLDQEVKRLKSAVAQAGVVFGG